MKAADFRKNFRLGEEVHIAGPFTYNRLTSSRVTDTVPHRAAPSKHPRRHP
jgi:hypothetical protein